MKKKKPRTLKPHPVPLPSDSYRSGTRREAESARRASGYTSLRVSKKTRELLVRVATQAQTTHANRAQPGYYSRYYSLGVDELLYFDALERLGELPVMVEPD